MNVLLLVCLQASLLVHVVYVCWGRATYSRAGSQIVFAGVVPYWIPC